MLHRVVSALGKRQSKMGRRKEMTMEEAQEILQEIKHYLTAGNPVWDVDEIAEACDMAIEALRNEINCVKCVHYTERETYTGIKGVCKIDTAHREDLISRSRAIKDISYWATNIIDPKMLVKEDALYILETLPSEEPKTGHWVEIEDYNGDIHYQCDQCGEEFILIDGTPEDNNYWHCPNCGSYNREVRKHED